MHVTRICATLGCNCHTAYTNTESTETDWKLYVFGAADGLTLTARAVNCEDSFSGCVLHDESWSADAAPARKYHITSHHIRGVFRGGAAGAAPPQSKFFWLRLSIA